MPRNRSPNLDGDRIASIVRVIGRLPGKPGWEDVVEAVRAQLGATYTRQALDRHPPIRLALQSRRRGTPARPGARPVSATSAAEAARTARLRRELDALRAQVAALLEVNVVRAYNAHAHGMSQEELDHPLPRIERD